jgi:hypothetical protein
MNPSVPRVDQSAGDNCTVVHVNGGTWYFSYRTLIAYSDGTGSYRLHNYWSKTTGKHFHSMGCATFKELTPEEFAHRIGYEGNPLNLTK